jgi:hypothetical protein
MTETVKSLSELEILAKTMEDLAKEPVTEVKKIEEKI